MNFRSLIALSAVAASGLVLAGCATGDAGAAEADGAVEVVASTDVYGQIAEEIGGGLVDVTSIIDSASQDPHSFEPSAQDQLLVTTADLIIENGGGYDAFVDALIESSGSDAQVITAAEFSHDYPGNDGHTEDAAAETAETHDAHAEEDGAENEHIEGFNEHVWYDPHTIEQVAEAIAAELSGLLPEEASTFEENAAAFVAEIADLEASLKEVGAVAGGAQVFATEPVPAALLAAAGLENVTPHEFSEAVEEGQDVPPATLLASLDLVNGGDVRVVIANTQTGGAETTQIVGAADARGIPVLTFSETLPDGQTYISWMQENVEALAGALQE
ncbi:metal ABC transporter solute-binding protein, Zn/Mn family [Microbacterium sp. DT81.1]|uniref:metal ABC transporter solute-binding protein, Zn/Mn family n=1 Tax=Microbacterium sp. DT81.1 TaxID=3393413 RepID=UPI003CF5753A